MKDGLLTLEETRGKWVIVKNGWGYRVEGEQLGPVVLRRVYTCLASLQDRRWLVCAAPGTPGRGVSRGCGSRRHIRDIAIQEVQNWEAGVCTVEGLFERIDIRLGMTERQQIVARMTGTEVHDGQ
jgi:hypothetical protein